MADPAVFRRRTLLAALATAACRPKAEPAATTTPSSPSLAPAARPEGGAIDADAIAAAERIAGVRYDDAERKQMVAVLEQQLQVAKLRRAHTIARELPPATLFDPRMPGTAVPDGRDSVRTQPIDAPPPKSDEDLAFASALQLGHWIARRSITSERVTELYLERLRTHGTKLQCVATLTDAHARERAREADREVARGRTRSKLHGVPWGAKDLFDTRGIATRWGAEPFADRVPDQDAFVVRRLADAGAVLVAKLTTGALAYGDVWDGGLTRNPWNPAEGSSGSSAGPGCATAAGLVGFSLGTETYGSIVSPSMVCGTTGLRPTFGRVARTGTMPLCWSLDKVGPICRTVEDAIAVLAAIHGADAGDPCSRNVPLRFDARAKLRAVRVGFLPAHFEGERANAIDRAALDGLKKLGAELVPIELPKLPWDALVTIVFAEAAATFEDLTLDGRDDRLRWQKDEAWPNIFRAARFLGAIDLLAADRLRRQAMIAFAERFAEVEIIAGPSYAEPLLLATNCTGHPSLTVRAGFETRPPDPLRDGSPQDTKPVECPRGFTLIGRLYEEGALCRLGLALERELAVAGRRPPGFG